MTVKAGSGGSSPTPARRPGRSPSAAARLQASPKSKSKPKSRGAGGRVAFRQGISVEARWHLPSRNDLKALVLGRLFNTKDFLYGKCVGKGSLSTVRMVLLKNADSRKPIPMALKVMRKVDILIASQQEHVRREKMILDTVSSPFIPQFLSSFQNPRQIFLLLEFVHGGDLYGRLEREGRLAVDSAKFYAAQLLLCIRYLHQRTIVYRDLKPENVLIDRYGHIKITDFAFSRMLKAGELAYTIVGTPEYMSPEIINSSGHSHPSDFWALGILIYEMLCGYPPFLDDCPYKIYEKVLQNAIAFPRHCDVKARNLLSTGLLVTQPAARFSILDCMFHPWLDFVDWEEMRDRKITPPWLPTVKGPLDTDMFKIVPDSEIMDRYADCPPIMKRDNEPFVEFF
eukprot:TRINITY_DN54943_c0_g1_i1.p1 TRINITY_DN54943_c0_g1~~TRINITY_DN54943_c0_g1_i1.p1  ORF type:complete len:398 (-),score=51.88 TRINITY_DN54943_c0_g1_i1:44-1237(-)